MINRGDDVLIRMWVVFEHDVEELIYGITVKTNDGTAVYGTNSRVLELEVADQLGGDLIQVEFRLKMNLLAGDYFISLGVAQDHNVKDNIAVDRRYDLIHLHVRETLDAFGFADLQGQMAITHDELDA